MIAFIAIAIAIAVAIAYVIAAGRTTHEDLERTLER
jgi:hypothetical protein